MNLVCTKIAFRCVQSKPWDKNLEEYYVSDPLHEKLLWDILIAYCDRQQVNPVIAWQWSQCWIVLSPRRIESWRLLVNYRKPETDFFSIISTCSIMIFFRLNVAISEYRFVARIKHALNCWNLRKKYGPPPAARSMVSDEGSLRVQKDRPSHLKTT